MKISEYIEYSAEVRQALEDGRPVVAIETAGTFEALPIRRIRLSPILLWKESAKRVQCRPILR